MTPRTEAPRAAPVAAAEEPSAAQPASGPPTTAWAMPPAGPPAAGDEPPSSSEPVQADFADEEPDDSLLDVGGHDEHGAGPSAEDDNGAPPATGGSSDPRVLTIRASRATPPMAEDDPEAKVILPANRPPLRPAQPAAQPRRRRFGRTTR
ncbi:MAG: hypothetical protein KY458_09765 [Actinobacteria bacterium]|nr:hypothetical protein [Actinomycetota bacterium]